MLAQPEQASDRELLAALGRRDVEADDAGERGDGQHQAGLSPATAEMHADRLHAGG